MNGSEADSLWLQKSIHLADPIPEATEEVVATAAPEVAATTARTDEELDLVKMTPNSFSMLCARQPSQRASCRHSIPNTAYANLHEIDELRARLAQVNRERLKWSSTYSELELARFELTRVQQELKTTQDYSKTIANELEEAAAKAERESKARHAAERQLSESQQQGRIEKELLRKQLESLREQYDQRLAEMTDRSDAVDFNRSESLREHVVKLTEELQAQEMSNASVEQDRVRLQAENERLCASMTSLREKFEESQRSLEGYACRYADLERMHAAFVEKVERSHAEALQSQMSLSDERLRQVTVSKDELVRELASELKGLKEANRSLSDEVSSLRHRCQLAAEEARQISNEHEKEIKRLNDEHRLALYQKELQAEAQVREAKGGKMSIEEENASLRRQLTKVSEELATATSALVQKEKLAAAAEEELGTVKEAALKREREWASVSVEIEALREALNHADERMQRLVLLQETTESDYSRDVRELKEKLAASQEELVHTKAELSTIKQDRMRLDAESISTISELRSRLDVVEREKEALQQLSEDTKQAQELAQEYREKYVSMCKKAENLVIELSAVSNRCALLERRLDEELRRSLRNASLSPIPAKQCGVGPRLCCASTANSLAPGTNRPAKRGRSAESRVFTISGFDGSDLLTCIRQLPHATVAECKPNAPVPSYLTHLVTNGQLTIKLLTALVRGCWVLPESYVRDSLKNKDWADETSYGFRHKDLPLARKRVAFTEKFTRSRHHSSARLVIAEGGALVESDPGSADFVLCTHGECDAAGEQGKMTWDKMVDLIYPVKLQGS
ncbi:hypothetical protein ERJ75_000242700 [Trypanosoma vivax]|nr:hypothetical protein TRVL_04890 [Trypanosoma vivax]KAH8618797.1 hypothetical protein ERJ75_000242700 [Trypanosoma vivax]